MAVKTEVFDIADDKVMVGLFFREVQLKRQANGQWSLSGKLYVDLPAGDRRIWGVQKIRVGRLYQERQRGQGETHGQNA